MLMIKSYATEISGGGTCGDIFLERALVEGVVGLLHFEELGGRVGARDLHDHGVLLVDAFRGGVRHRGLSLHGVKHPVAHRRLEITGKLGLEPLEEALVVLLLVRQPDLLPLLCVPVS